MRGLIKNSKGQVWVETVIYTLIGLAIIGIVLAGALPKINDKKSEIMIDQSIQALTLIDDKIYEIQRATGNRRSIKLEVKSGSFAIDMGEDKLIWTLESTFAYSEPGRTVPLGNLNITTLEKGGNSYDIIIESSYGQDLTFNGKNTGTKEFTQAPIPYNIVIDNLGKQDDRIVIDFSETN